MRRQEAFTIRFGLGAILGAMLAACMTAPVEGPDGPGRVTLEIAGNTAPGVVAPDLRLLEVTLVSSARDTVRDTITRDGSRRSVEPAFLDGRNGRVHMFPRYELKAGRRWNVHVRSVDHNDSIVHAESLAVGGLRPFEHRAARLDLSPRWAGYAARLAVPGTLRAGRVVLRVDGEAVRDTVIASQHAGRTVELAHPYVAPGLRRIELQVFGALEGEAEDAAERLLLHGGTTLDAGLARVAAEETVALAWADTAMTGSDADAEAGSPTALQFHLGAIGTLRVNVHVSGGVIL